jgi:glycosyltransferase involved in cell wall biosynthesis
MAVKNLLFISSYPFPLDKGSNQHAFYFLKALTRLFNVYCVFFVQPERKILTNPQDALHELDIKHYDLCFFHHPRKEGKIKSALRAITAFPGTYMSLATTPEGRIKIEKAISRYSIDIVHIEHFHYLKYAFQLSGNFKKVIVYHDLHHSIYWQQVRFQNSRRSMLLSILSAGKYYLFERFMDHKVDTKVFLNPAEMAALPKKSVYIPHVVNQSILYRKPRDRESFNILFVGSYNHPPNRLSLNYIVERILPILANRTKKFKFHIVGSGTESFQHVINNSPIRDFVVIRGFEKDINKVFQDMDLALFPIQYGGGIKTKLIDAMAAGVPVVTTPEGIFGLHNLPDNCIGVGNTPAELLEQVSLLMESYSMRLKRSTAAKKYIASEYSFDTFSKKISEIYLRL